MNTQIRILLLLRWSALMLTFCPLLFIMTGCGQAAYDKLVKQQIGTLGSWQVFRSDFGYEVNMPEGGKITSDRQDEGNSVLGSETKEASWQSWFFRAEATRIKNRQINLGSEADSLEQYYSSEGYTIDSRQDTQANRLSAVDLRFSKADGGALAVRVVELDNAAVRLTISGPAPDQSITDRFFGSIQRAQLN